MTTPTRGKPPLPASPEALMLLLDEATASVEHYLRLAVALDRVLEADHAEPRDEFELGRRIERVRHLQSDERIPPTRNVADLVPWPFTHGGPIRIDDYRTWQLQVLAGARGHQPALAVAHARVFDRLRARIMRRLAGEPDEEPAPEPVACPVRLRGPARGPIVFGIHEQPILAPAQYPVVLALVEAFPRRLSGSVLKGEVRRLTGRRNPGSPHRRLSELAAKPGLQWRHLDLCPGPEKSRGYGFSWPASPDLAVVSPHPATSSPLPRGGLQS